jgi:SAM-dependent methyltransferase
MDEPHLDWAQNRRALADLDRITRLLLGFGSIQRSVLPRVLAAGARTQLLIDIGTGSGIAAARVAAAAARGGKALRVVGVDRKLTHLVLGRRFGISQLRVVASAEALPFRSGAADWALSTLFWHHFDLAANRAILAEARRVARLGVMVVDLRRSRVAAGLARVLLPAAGAGPIARQDGYVSLACAWSLDEVREAAADATGDWQIAELRRRFPFRFSLVLVPVPVDDPARA